MNFKNNKGYVVVDATIAVIIFMILIPVLMGMVYRVNLTNHETKIKAEVINILVNTIETAKGIELENLTEEKVINKLQDTYTISKTSNSAVITTSIASYKLKVSVVDYHDTHSDAKENVLKTVKAVVTYKIGNKEKTMDLSTVVK